MCLDFQGALGGMRLEKQPHAIILGKHRRTRMAAWTSRALELGYAHTHTHTHTATCHAARQGLSIACIARYQHAMHYTMHARERRPWSMYRRHVCNGHTSLSRQCHAREPHTHRLLTCERSCTPRMRPAQPSASLSRTHMTVLPERMGRAHPGGSGACEQKEPPGRAPPGLRAPSSPRV